MFISVSGPHSPKGATSSEDAASQIVANVDRANKIGITLI